jgi:translation elongation factor EF-G
MEIEDIEFGQFPENKLNLLNIKNAPSKNLVEATYKEYHYRKAGITYADAESNLPTEHLRIENSLEKRFIKFVETNDEDIPQSVKDLCLRYFAAVG